MEFLKSFRSKYTFLRYRNVQVLILARLIWGLTESLCNPFFSLFVLAQAGSTEITLGFIVLFKVVGAALIAPIGGYLTDTLGRVKTIGIGSALESAAYLFFAFAHDSNMVLLGVLFQSLTRIHSSARIAILHDTIKPKERGVGFSAVRALQAIPNIVSPLIGGILVGIYGIDYAVRLGLIISSLTGFLATFIRYRFLEETLDLSKPRKESGSALHRIQRQVSEGYKGMFDVLKYSSTLKIVILIAIYRTFFASMIGDFTIVYATNVINITTAQWGFIVSVTGLITTVFKFFSGNLIDWFGKRRIILVTLVCEPIYNILFIYSQTFMHVLNMIIFRSIINSLLEPASEGYFADLVPREKRGRAIAAIGANLFGRSMTGYLRFIPLTLGSFLSGYIYKTDPKYPWLIFSISSIVGIVLSLIYVKEQKEEEE